MNSEHVSDAAMEARTRRAAKRVGLIARKSRGRLGSIDNYGQFQLVDAYFNRIEYGEKFDLSPETVIEICKELAATLPDR